ncbi:hypothetical protein ACFSKU_17560 [Pontibacter silvestris]|uniref:Lipoprotein n=1 Tax=Pontibacter silvestris TaxID=2305183 RepID=A0ABW4X291_9BACT|nr:hypothetical protein [Pontibacter silvestris]MCC9135832.1 hypothetical protein [Pontibacter silvestris]
MKRTFTSVNSGLYLLVVCCLLLFYSSCTTRVDHKAKEQQVTELPVPVKETGTITVAAIAAANDEVYFDLIAETSACLGENLWIGGKVESAEKMALGKSGDISPSKVYEIKELTATGLSTNSSYTLSNGAGIIRAACDDKGVVYIQLSEGQLQLLTASNTKPVIVAYQPQADNAYVNGTVGNWTCQ